MLDWVLVGLGGFIGSVCRYFLSLLPYSEKTGFPVITLAINVLGALLIGILAGLSMRVQGIDPRLLTFLRVGFCGGFTTFSTFALEISGLMDAGRGWAGAGYVILSLVLGVAAVFAGKALAS
ncbi:MAG TPA: fluoride efflux transporter CrcB [Candidatus Limiplasma sp.]|nr:fluoride efflux transporter CrcB [Candidatus Limiplasma sp.]